MYPTTRKLHRRSQFGQELAEAPGLGAVRVDQVAFVHHHHLDIAKQVRIAVDAADGWPRSRRRLAPAAGWRCNCPTDGWLGGMARNLARVLLNQFFAGHQHHGARCSCGQVSDNGTARQSPRSCRCPWASRRWASPVMPGAAHLRCRAWSGVRCWVRTQNHAAILHARVGACPITEASAIIGSLCSSA